ncbi:hypothetical protein [Bacillus sp. AFS094611]|nr:hypothetical protein [Bacillus sp. AFS094611]
MFWLGNVIGSVLGSFVTFDLLYFDFRAEETKIAVMPKNYDGNKV